MSSVDATTERLRAELGAEFQNAWRARLEHGRKGFAYAQESGGVLYRAELELPPEQYKEFVRDDCGIGERQARKLRRLYEHRKHLEDVDTSQLTIDEACYIISRAERALRNQEGAAAAIEAAAADIQAARDALPENDESDDSDEPEEGDDTPKGANPRPEAPPPQIMRIGPVFRTERWKTPPAGGKGPTNKKREIKPEKTPASVQVVEQVKQSPNFTEALRAAAQEPSSLFLIAGISSDELIAAEALIGPAMARTTAFLAEFPDDCHIFTFLKAHGFKRLERRLMDREPAAPVIFLVGGQDIDQWKDSVIPGPTESAIAGLIEDYTARDELVVSIGSAEAAITAKAKGRKAIVYAIGQDAHDEAQRLWDEKVSVKDRVDAAFAPRVDPTVATLTAAVAGQMEVAPVAAALTTAGATSEVATAGSQP